VRLWILVWLLAILFALAGCSAGETPDFVPIAPADFPKSLGGGFPVARVVAKVDDPAEVGKSAPNFAFVWADGRGADLVSLRGRPVVINFWATWCAPCRAEMPEFVALHQTNPDLTNPDLVVLEINTQESLDIIRPFAQEFGMTMPVLVDEVGVVRSLYGVRNMPTTLFVDAAGVIHARWAGLLTGERLDEFVAQIQ